MREVIRAVGSGVVDVIRSRSAGRIQTEKVASAFCNLVVGAGSVVTEGRSFPDNSLIVGAPGRVISTLDEKAVAMIRAGADIYVQRSRRYAKGLKRSG